MPQQSKVRINVSSGPKPVATPNVVGQNYDSASSYLLGQGFAVKRTDVDSPQPPNTVIAQDPAVNTSIAPGSTITLTVSRGPKDKPIPSVVNLDIDSARTTLTDSGFKVRVVYEPTQDQSLDGVVTLQDPPSGTQAKPGTTVTITVGQYSSAATTTVATDAAASVSRKLRVAVVAGGRSSEHEISLASARSVLGALDPERYETVTIAIGRDGRWELGPGPSRQVLVSDTGTGPAETLPVPATSQEVTQTLGAVDVVLPILHGPFGEDGTVQGLLELAGVPYVGAGVAASAVCMDKDLCKAVLRDRGIPVTRNVTLRDGDAIDNPFAFPVFVKPARLGSSVGITKAHDEDELRAAVELARRHDDKVLIEEFVAGTEVECGVLGNRRPTASVVGEIVPHAEWYDYGAKYDDGGSDIVVPARIPDEQAHRVQALAVDSFVATECEGMARVDFFIREDGEVVVNEINTIPGFTETSVYARLFEASGIPYPELLQQLIDLALERHERRSTLRY